MAFLLKDRALAVASVSCLSEMRHNHEVPEDVMKAPMLLLWKVYKP